MHVRRLQPEDLKVKRANPGKIPRTGVSETDWNSDAVRRTKNTLWKRIILDPVNNNNATLSPSAKAAKRSNTITRNPIPNDPDITFNRVNALRIKADHDRVEEAIQRGKPAGHARLTAACIEQLEEIESTR